MRAHPRPSEKCIPLSGAGAPASPGLHPNIDRQEENSDQVSILLHMRCNGTDPEYVRTFTAGGCLSVASFHFVIVFIASCKGLL